MGITNVLGGGLKSNSLVDKTILHYMLLGVFFIIYAHTSSKINIKYFVLPSYEMRLYNVSGTARKIKFKL